MVKRLVLFCDRFWPLVGRSSTVSEKVATGFQRSGWDVTIVTSSPYAEWPPQIVYNETTVFRLLQHARGMLARFRFARLVNNWLCQRSDRFDAAYVISPDIYLASVIRCFRDGPVKVAVRVEDAVNGAIDRRIEKAIRRSRSTAWRKRNASDVHWIATTPTIYQRLLATGTEPEFVTYIPDGFDVRPLRSGAQRYEAREALGAINHDLQVAEYAPVVTSIGRLDEGRGLRELINGWAPIALGMPAAQLWLIGDGPARSSLYEQCVELGLHHQVRLPGTFDDIDGVFDATDVYVNSSADSNRTAMLQAMASNLPIVARDSTQNRWILDSGQAGFLTGDTKSFTQNLRHLLENPYLAKQFGVFAGERIQREFSLKQMTSRLTEAIQ